jgi:DNA-binding SARP family transcriptional activator
MMDHPEAFRCDAQSSHAASRVTPAPPESAAASADATGLAEAPADEAGEIRSNTLHFFTLGRFDVLLPAHAGRRRPIWETGQARVVLKCLLAAPDCYLSREQLMESLWPEQTVAQARDSLRHSLSRLRRALEPDRLAYRESRYLGSDRCGVWLRLDAGSDVASRIWIDDRRFETLSVAALALLGPGHSGHDTRSIESARRSADEALALYRGPFLTIDRHAEWANPRRLHCLSLWTALARRRAALAVAEHDLEHAALLFGRLVQADPEDEDATGRLMCIEAALGHRSEAVRIYERLSARLTTTLDTRPTRELQELAYAIRMSESTQALRLLLLRQFSPA